MLIILRIEIFCKNIDFGYVQSCINKFTPDFKRINVAIEEIIALENIKNFPFVIFQKLVISFGQLPN